MKKTLLVITLIFISFFSYSQPKKYVGPKKDSVSIKIPSNEIKSDTIKVRVILYAKNLDGTTILSWENAYLVNKSTFTPVTKITNEEELKKIVLNGEGTIGLANTTQDLYSTRWTKFDLKDIYEIKQMTW